MLQKLCAHAFGSFHRPGMIIGLVVVALLPGLDATAAQASVDLGTAAPFGVLAASTVTSTGDTIVNGDFGLSPGTSVVGFPPGVVNGATHVNNASAAQAHTNLAAAYADAAGRMTDAITVAGDLGGQTLTQGLYNSSSSLAISSADLTLDAQGDTNAVWIFQMGSTLTTTAGRQVVLTNGARSANVFWQVGSSATLGAGSGFKGTILADQSITLVTGATLDGRALAKNAAVTLDANTITVPDTPLIIVTAYEVGVTNQISDGQMTGGTYSVQFTFHALAGMSNSVTHPSVDFHGPSGNQLVTGQLFATATHGDNGRSLLVSNSTVATVPADSIVLGVHTSRWSAYDSNSVGVINNTLLSNATPITFIVVDDDTDGPTAATNQNAVVGRDWTNADFIVQWATTTVADVSGISAYRISTNTPSDNTGGTNAGLATQFVWAVGTDMEGVRTNFLYAVDDDRDRTNDQMIGASATFTTRLDRTPPAKVTNVDATITGVFDDSTQIKLTWTPLTNAGHRASDGDPLSPWKSYVVFFTTNDTAPTTNSASLRTDNGPPDLGTNTTGLLIFSNLATDTIYTFALVGLDVAGNLGPLSAVVTQRTTGLILTQGIVVAAQSVTVKWNMKPGLVYDVIYQDARSWDDALTNNWKLMETVTNSFPADAGGAARASPFLMGNTTLRFYRVSGTGQWITNSPGRNRTATREIYVAKSVALVPGENWLSLFFDPDANTAASVLGTNRLPGGATIASATKVSWYSSASASVATNLIWLSSSGNWIYGIGGTGLANDKALPLHEGFNIELPGSASTNLLLVGRLPTNVLSYGIGPGGPGLGNDVFSIRSHGIPRRITLAQSGLKGPLIGQPNKGAGPDEIRVLNNAAGIGSKTSPKSRVWLNSANNTFTDWYTGLSAETNTLDPGDTLIIVRRNTATTTVLNALHYSPPGPHINP